MDADFHQRSLQAPRRGLIIYIAWMTSSLQISKHRNQSSVYLSTLKTSRLGRGRLTALTTIPIVFRFSIIVANRVESNETATEQYGFLEITKLHSPRRSAQI